MPSVADPAQRAALERQRRLWQAGWGMSGRYAGEVPELRWITLDAGAGSRTQLKPSEASHSSGSPL